MVKPLLFKGDKKQQKKRKRTAEEANDGAVNEDGERQVKAPKADEDEGEEGGSDDSWVSVDAVTDLAGPVMFVLPSDPPTALACDAIGKVFALPIENIADGNPSSAEPHDVRQVWVANKIVGTEHYRFKGHHGKHLSCDKYGVFSATSEAVTPQESFIVIATADTPGTFQIQTLRDTFLTVRESKLAKANALPDVRGDATDITFDSTLRIRMQARFKPRIKAQKVEKAWEKISRRDLEDAVGRKLEEDEVKSLRRARKEGNYHELLLDMKVKNKHDKYG
ncbi:FRG1-like family-domain-containing protein [Lasiosphaeria miniovina]|uniref:FRG1-like family-domain-containing protein n=1 Tax=Lasiosphaeria miniovina TaxID=1954250 RepID=A0AA40BIY3_9PEZI|nr:FRG1-like family-domain-containing protein [Lasiosphaeria miniovina]KAK0735032.1 FRG1-like family-domain-containing protein [Lasiosphaeria miniovina]